MFKKQEQPTISEFSDREGLERAIREFGVSAPAARRLAELGRDSLHLKAVGQDAHVGNIFSKIGGIPDLPKGADWPIRPSFPASQEEAPKNFLKRAINRLLYTKPSERELNYRNTPQPYSFIAQVSFSEMAAVQTQSLDLPDSGALYLFYDALSGGWGFDPADAIGFKVIYAPDMMNVARAQSPDFFEEVPTFEEKCVQPIKRFEHCPSWGLHFEALSLSDDDREKYEQFDDLVNERGGLGWPSSPAHKVRGWSNIIQNPMEEECALVTSGVYCGDANGYNSPEAKRIMAQSNDWVQLLQVDSDDSPGMMWGDAGMLYLWIKASDLQNGNFERTWLILQCG